MLGNFKTPPPSPPSSSNEITRIRDVIRTPNRYAMVTQLPNAEVLKATIATLSDYDADLANTISQCWKNLYSYVVDRNFIEDQHTFAHHVAGAFIHEIIENKLLNNRDHGLKCVTVYGNVKKTLKALEKAITKLDNDETDEALFLTIEDCLSEFKGHLNILIKVLYYLTDEQKTFMRENDQNFDLETEKEYIKDNHYHLTREDKKAIMAFQISTRRRKS